MTIDETLGDETVTQTSRRRLMDIERIGQDPDIQLASRCEQNERSILHNRDGVLGRGQRSGGNPDQGA